MQEAENSVQALVAEDQDCSEPSQALLRMRVRMAELCRKKVALGDKSELSGQVKVLPPKPPTRPPTSSRASKPTSIAESAW